MSEWLYMAMGVTIALAAGFILTRGDQYDPSSSTSTTVDGVRGALADVSVPDVLSENAVIGERGFEAKCAACHGENAAGVDGVGPPLVHKIYEPNHHGDAAFWLATQNGVRAHHWSFGNMPPVGGLTKAEVGAIVTYIRELQIANGIL